MDFFVIIISLFCFKSSLVSASCLEINEFDYIVVGSGTSGGIIATRLSENTNNTVLLLEAGGEPSEISNVPLLSFNSLRTRMDWNYSSTPQKHCCDLFNGNVLPIFRGKVLGGSGTLNTLIFTRGNRKDFDFWEQQRNPGWSYKDLMYYFLKIEDYQISIIKGDEKYHSVGGPMTVSTPDFKTPMAKAFLEAGEELGQPLVDFNARTQTGFMYPPFNIKNGVRCSTYLCYLKPAMTRKNLHVLTHALVTKLIIDEEKRATGVQYSIKSKKCTAKARKEVIVSGGVINTPHLLLLSGIGPKKTLKKFGIDVIADLPGVGQNMQDHVTMGGQMYTMKKNVTFNRVRYRTEKYLNQWYENKTGPMLCPEATEGIAFYQSKLVHNEIDFPDIEICLNSDNMIPVVKQFINPLFPIFLPKACEDMITFFPMILRPKSRGYVTLKSNNPHDHPIINPRYLSHPDDQATLLEALKLVRKLGNTKTFKKYGAKLALGGFVPNCMAYLLWPEEYLKCLVKVLSLNFYHPTSTCKMGPISDPMAVVDHRLRVHGIKNLRVADASIMPTTVSGHPNAACMVIGEKVSDMIKEDDNNFSL